jgi:hypothetical protein
MGVAVVALVLIAAGCINNGAWTALPAPVSPVQDLPTRLYDVSCVSEDWCLAVGSMADDLPLAEVWDGTEWSVVSAPPIGPEGNQAVAVACGTPTSCVVKVNGWVETDSYDAVAAWDGTTWQSLVAVQEGPYVESLPFSCAPDGTCVVVSNYGGDTLVWDGDSVTTLPNTATGRGWDVNAIECFAADLCVAATNFTIDIWDGATWTEQAGSDSSDIFVFGPSAFACGDASHCVGVGENAAETGLTSAVWDGSSWTEVPLPAGVTSTGSLECVGVDECLLRVIGVPTGTLAWMAGSWVQAPAPVAGASVLSCLPGWCLGVGSTGPATLGAATYEWTNP